MILKIIYYNKNSKLFFYTNKMKKIIKIIILIIILGFNYANAKINLTVSPIKYELEGEWWTSITKTAILQNRWNKDIKIITWKSDFIAKWTNGTPTFVRYSELVHPDQQLSSWISLSSTWFTIPANSKKEINFTINIPKNATPGWHYWAVFFKNNNSESSNWNWTSVWINVDYGIIILLKVKWKIITKVNIDNIIISGWNSKLDKQLDKHSKNDNFIKDINSSNKKKKKNYNLVWNKPSILLKKDKCLFDFTSSNFDWKCFDEPKKVIKLITWKDKKEENKTSDNNKNNNKKDFNISFKIPVENKWNTHIKTTWEIKLFDENWKQIKQIWKKVIVNKKWAIIWEKIVDYIPINDNNGNVLPWTKRVFKPEWKGFPYKEYSQEQWKEIIKYKNPWEYYTDKELQKEFRLLPWERVCYDKQTKKITAKFDISYLNEQWKEVSFPSAKEFDVTYTRKYIWYNYYLIFSVIAILIFLFILFWIIWLLRKKKCINNNCRKKINKKLKICPYCETLQEKDKKSKKFNKKTKKK